MEVKFECENIKAAGAPTDASWSGNFVEKPPPDSDRLSFRGQLFLVITVKSTHASQELGHKFWINFSSRFYANLTGSILTALQEAANAAFSEISAEESFEEVDFVAASLWGKILYLAQSGQAAAGLVRSGKFSYVLPATGQKPARLTSASGFLKDLDLVFLATISFFEKFPSLEKFVSLPTLEIEEDLDSKVIQSGQPEMIAVQVLKIAETTIPGAEEVITFAQVEDRKVSLLKSKVLAKFNSLSRQQIWQYWTKFFPIISKPIKVLIKLLPKREIYLTSKSALFSKKRLFTLILLILIIILIASLTVGIWQRQRKARFEKFEKHLTSAQTLYDEAVAISGLNRLRSRELLTDAQKNLNEALKLKFEKNKVAELSEKIKLANLKSLKLVKIENPNLVFDLALLKANSQISEIEKLENVFVFDKTSVTLFLADQKLVTGQIVAGGAEFAGFANFTISGNSADFLKPGDGIYQFDLTSKVLKKVIEADSAWGEILDLTSFGGNLYLLDGKLGQIWKYTPTTDGFSAIRGFLAESGKFDFTGASFTIDGFIWVLTGLGKLYKATPAEVKLVEISGLDKPFSPKTILRTNAEAENLYIGDLGNARILVLGKNGLYLAQYSSGTFSNITDFTVDEVAQKLYFAQNSKIFQFDLAK